VESNPSPNYRAVLIGIDDYTQRPLNGCVNDIDQIERILLDRLQVPAERITRFAAPRAEAASTTRLPSLHPTRDELRSFLESLAGEVGPDDVVFLYYSGHGSRVTTEVNGQRISREALVPVDSWSDSDPQHRRLLYDYELNGLLARIAERAGDLTVVLDCCHSASVDRGEGERQVEIPETQQLSSEALPGGDLAKDASGLASATAPHMLVAACRANESAYEVKPVKPDETWPQQGAFTRTLVQILDAIDKPLQTLRWWDIAIALADRLKALADANRPQNPLIVGHEGRRVFGGPWTRRDLGYALSQNGESFRIGAGTLTGLSEGAEVAVYGAEPDRFPDLNSKQDQAARIGLLRVDKAERSSCTALPVNGGFKLPQGARGRLVRPGEPDRLVVALDPFDAQLAGRLEAWGIVGVSPETPEAEARLRRENGQLHLGDEIYDRGGQPPLASFPGDRPGLAEVVLDHYARYCQALRLTARCRDLAGALELKLLRSPERQISPEDLQAPGFDELTSDGPWRYKVKEGDGFVIRIENRAIDPLHVFVLNCAGSGRVEHLGSAQIPAGAMHVLWSGQELGIPFYPTVATERTEIVDCLIVVGTTLPDQDLSYLEVDSSFAEVIARFPDREFGTRSLSTLVEKWTAEMVTVRIYK
jgi:caspase domain-containing protein